MKAGMTGRARGKSNFSTYDDSKFFNVLCHNKSKCFIDIDNTLREKKATTSLYFAGPWFDERSEQLYDACEQIIDVAKGKTKYDVYFPRKAVNESPLDAFEKNVQHINECQTVVALIDQKDVGTAWEIGMAYAKGANIILLGYDETSFLSHTNVMLAFTGTCITLDQFANFLTGQPYTKIKIKNEWEGIE